MALFSKKTDKESTAPKQIKSVHRDTVVLSKAHVLRHARITEKATTKAMESVYVFDVAQSATKGDIAKAISAIYQVKPHKIAVAKIPSKSVRSLRTGITGVKRGGKKAYVYLKKGETIIIS